MKGGVAMCMRGGEWGAGRAMGEMSALSLHLQRSRHPRHSGDARLELRDGRVEVGVDGRRRRRAAHEELHVH